MGLDDLLGTPRLDGDEKNWSINLYMQTALPKRPIVVDPLSDPPTKDQIGDQLFDLLKSGARKVDQ